MWQLIGDLTLQRRTVLRLRVDVVLYGLCVSLLGTEVRVPVRENDTGLDVEVDIVAGDDAAIHVLMGINVADTSGLVSVRVLAELV